MTFPGWSANFGVNAMGAGRVGSTRGRIQGSFVNGVNYPNPFFDVAHTYLPTTVKEMFKYCRYYFLTNPLINATIFKLSEYPITDIIIDHENRGVKRRWEEYFHDHLQYRPFQVECGLDYNCYGNSCVSIHFPFVKHLICRNCHFAERADKIRDQWTFTNFGFRLTCPRCGHTDDADVKDRYYKSAAGIRLIRWNVEDIEVTYNDISGETTYFYNIPGPLRSDIVIGKKDVVEKVPQIFIQALRQQKGVVFSKDNFFHMKRPTLAWQDRGWGIPLILPVLKDAFYLQLMKKAQEAILLEHIVPLRIMFPQAASGAADPFCVAPDTLVETVGGLLPACEVGEGDYLRSHTGAWRRVEARSLRSVRSGEKVFKFKVASLSAFPFVLSEEHPVLAVRRPDGSRRGRHAFVDPEFTPAARLKKGDYVAYPVNRRVRRGEELDLADYIKERAVTGKWVYHRLEQQAAEIYEWLEENNDPKNGWGERRQLLEERGWSEQNYNVAYAMRREGSIDRVTRFFKMTPGLAALIGWYLAEGSLNGSQVSFSLHLEEKRYAEEIEGIVRGLGYRGVSHSERPEQNGRSVQIEDVILSALLVGMCGEGFANKRMPAVVSEGPDNVVLEALSRLFLGDGCDFHTRTNRVGLKLANPSLLLEARRLLLSFGLIGGTAKEEPTETSKFRTTAYQLNYNGAVADRLRLLFRGEQSRADDDVPQKSGLFRDGYVLLRINEVEEVNDVPEVVGFQMRGDRSFCVAGVATHNTTINLVEWKEQVAAEIARWRYDNNYIPIMPLPLGTQTVGGDGRTLLMFQEMEMHSTQLIMGMGVPQEFLKGGLSYAGTNVSMRMLENAFIGYVLRHRLQANWIMRMVANYLDWPEVNIRFKPFKMADDIQRKQLLFQLNQAQKISDTTLLADSDFNQEDEDEIMVRETALRLESTKKQQLAMAEVQGEQQLIMMKYQAKAQQGMMQEQGAPAPGEPGGVEGAMDPAAAAQQGAAQPTPGNAITMGAPPVPEAQLPPDQNLGALPGEATSQLSSSQRLPQGAVGLDPMQLAQSLAQQIAQLPAEQKQMALDAIYAQSAELGQLVSQFLGGGGGPTPPSVDMRPQPNVYPERRATPMV
jgi:intein/homing endonuclease